MPVSGVLKAENDCVPGSTWSITEHIPVSGVHETENDLSTYQYLGHLKAEMDEVPASTRSIKTRNGWYWVVPVL